MNNNLSLVNTDVVVGDNDSTWSLMIYRLEHFKVSYALILPFKPELDSRGIIRLSTTFSSLRRDCRVFCRVKNVFLDGIDRKPIIDGLINRIRLGFGWRDGNYNRHKIRRYRLLMLLSSPDLTLDSSIDVHHLDGLQSILDGIGDIQTIDDRFINLKCISRNAHSALHIGSGDTGFVDM